MSWSAPPTCAVAGSAAIPNASSARAVVRRSARVFVIPWFYPKRGKLREALSLQLRFQQPGIVVQRRLSVLAEGHQLHPARHLGQLIGVDQAHDPQRRAVVRLAPADEPASVVLQPGPVAGLQLRMVARGEEHQRLDLLYGQRPHEVEHRCHLVRMSRWKGSILPSSISFRRSSDSGWPNMSLRMRTRSE